MHVINVPYDQWEETNQFTGETRTVLVRRVPQFGQWIQVVFEGSVETGRFHIAYANRRLERRYGGRPWLNQP